ncbi:hypothetical protein RF11_15520 [Thelohanellus kitauei]|uniref:Uncharacterized protein n=1 Tax=Thelohanellus kitauei TaxID=669202 RepID=A0A0C2N944_THEKT|nr:hypothetical protein RF11_15520 [Thelohanellus kitauei]
MLFNQVSSRQVFVSMILGLALSFEYSNCACHELIIDTVRYSVDRALVNPGERAHRNYVPNHVTNLIERYIKYYTDNVAQLINTDVFLTKCLEITSPEIQESKTELGTKDEVIFEEDLTSGCLTMSEDLKNCFRSDFRGRARQIFEKKYYILIQIIEWTTLNGLSYELLNYNNSLLN